MLSDISSFVEYLREVKKTSKNTEISYQRDLHQMCAYLEGLGIKEVSKVTRTSLNSYVLYLAGGKSHHHDFTGAGIHQGIFPLRVKHGEH